MAKLFNLARMLSSTVGTGTLTLTTAVAPFLTFAQAGIADGDIVSYSIIDGVANSEIGIGTYTAAGTTLTRTVTRSTNSNAAISLSGSAQVLITPRAEDLFPPSTFIPGGRLSLTTGTPVTESNVTAATTVYLAIADLLNTAAYDGATFTQYPYTGELSLALDSNAAHTGYHQSGKNYDFFEYWTGSAVGVGTGPAWTSDTARGTGAGTTEIEIFQGIAVNKNSITLRIGSASGNTVVVAARQARLRGGFRCTADGQTEQSTAKQFVWDLYRPVVRPLSVVDATASWPYTTAGYRQANGSTANQIAWFVGVSGRRIEAHAYGKWSGATTVGVTTGIGIDSTTANGAQILRDNVVGSGATVFTANTEAHYTGYPGLGYHYAAWLEYGGAGASAYGNNSGVTAQTGIQGSSLQ